MNTENKKHYLIYQTTNLVNGKIYIGKHITENIEDQYFGSGKNLKRAIEKYGLENFEFKILMDLNSEDEMNLLEKCVVTQEFCDREDTYNINVGGDGGWNYVNSSGSNMNGNWKSISECSKNIFEQTGHYPNEGWLEDLKTNDPEKYQEFCSSVSKGVKTYIKENGFWWSGKHHKEETKQKIRDSHAKNHPQAGSKNSQFGMIAIYNMTTFERATQPKDQHIPEGWAKGRFYNATPEELIKRKKLLEQILEIDPNSKATIRYRLADLEKMLLKLQNPQANISASQTYLIKQLKKIENQSKRLKKIELLTEQYLYFDEFGWNEFVKKYNYQYTQINFIQQCQRYVKEYVPQNGKKRGK